MKQLDEINRVLLNIKTIQRKLEEYHKSRTRIDEAVKKELETEKKRAEELLRQIRF